MASLLKMLFGCCFGARTSDEDIAASRPLLQNDSLDDTLRINLPTQPPVIRRDEEILTNVLREAESKMVNVLDRHPFLLRPPAHHQTHHTPTRSESRSASPREHSADFGSERSQSIGLTHGRPPVLNVKSLKTYRGRPKKLSGIGRGRERTRARDGKSLSDERRDSPHPEVTPLSTSDEELLRVLSSDVRRALVNGFQIRDVGKVVQGWDDT